MVVESVQCEPQEEDVWAPLVEIHTQHMPKTEEVKLCWLPSVTLPSPSTYDRQRPPSAGSQQARAPPLQPLRKHTTSIQYKILTKVKLKPRLEKHTCMCCWFWHIKLGMLIT
jgi:hypothetical protein